MAISARRCLIVFGGLALLLAACSGGGAVRSRSAPVGPEPRLTEHPSGVPMPRTLDGRPVVLVPGPQRDAYLEAKRHQLPLVAHPPANVAAAGTIVEASASGLVLRVPPAVRTPQGAGPLHMVPALAAPGSTVRVRFVPTTHFLVAHGDRSLAPGSPILVMGTAKGSALRGVLVTDLSGVRAGAVSRPAAVRDSRTAAGAPFVAGQQASGRNAYFTADRGGPPGQEVVGSGSWGWDGINAGINNASWGDENGCPYFGFVAQLAVGFGDEWHFPLHLGLDTGNRLAVASDPAGADNGRPTFYSAFGGAAQLQITLSCKVPIPTVTIFGHTFGGGSIGPRFTFGPNYGLLMQNSTDLAAPLLNDQVVQVPATSCFTLMVPDMIPGLGSVWETIHAPELEVPICPSIGIQPAAFKATVNPPAGSPQAITLSDHQDTALGYVPGAGSAVHLNTFSFAPQAQVHLTAGLSLGLPKRSGSSPKNSGVPPLATARCKDGNYSFSQHARGTCSHHGGVAERLPPSGPSASDSPDPLWWLLSHSHLDAGPWILPLVGLHAALGTTWNPDTIDLTAGGAGTAGPALGQLTGLFAHAKGYGEIEPSQINNGGDPTGVVTQITWKSWGAAKAIGSGIGDYVASGQAAAAGTQEPVTIVAFNLGSCDGKRMYQAVEWYFPQHGQTFNSSQYENICTGTFVTNTASPSDSSSPSLRPTAPPLASLPAVPASAGTATQAVALLRSTGLLTVITKRPRCTEVDIEGADFSALNADIIVAHLPISGCGPFATFYSIRAGAVIAHANGCDCGTQSRAWTRLNAPYRSRSPRRFHFKSGILVPGPLA